MPAPPPGSAQLHARRAGRQGHLARLRMLCHEARDLLRPLLREQRADDVKHLHPPLAAAISPQQSRLQRCQMRNIGGAAQPRDVRMAADDARSRHGASSRTRVEGNLPSTIGRLRRHRRSAPRRRSRVRPRFFPYARARALSTSSARHLTRRLPRCARSCPRKRRTASSTRWPRSTPSTGRRVAPRASCTETSPSGETGQIRHRTRE